MIVRAVTSTAIVVLRSVADGFTFNIGAGLHAAVQDLAHGAGRAIFGASRGLGAIGIRGRWVKFVGYANKPLWAAVCLRITIQETGLRNFSDLRARRLKAVRALGIGGNQDDACAPASILAIPCLALRHAILIHADATAVRTIQTLPALSAGRGAIERAGGRATAPTTVVLSCVFPSTIAIAFAVAIYTKVVGTVLQFAVDNRIRCIADSEFVAGLSCKFIHATADAGCADFNAAFTIRADVLRSAFTALVARNALTVLRARNAHNTTGSAFATATIRTTLFAVA